jgi:hypothetical protein
VIANCRSNGLPLSMTLMSVKGMQMNNCIFTNTAAPDVSDIADCTFNKVMVNGALFQPS